MPRSRQTPTNQAPPVVRWPWDSRGRELVARESIKRDMRAIADLIREHFEGHVPGVAFRVPQCP